MTPVTKKPTLSVIIPAYNEEERIPETIRIIEEFLGSRKISWELLVVDDGSRDRTIQVSNETMVGANSRVIHSPKNMGKGAAVRRGMLEAKGRYRLFTDADNSTPIEESLKLLQLMRSREAQVAIGSRALKGSKLEKRQPIHRETMGKIFNRVVQLLVIPGIKDTQCGFKMFTEAAAEHVFNRQTLDGFSFDVEALMLARSGGYTVIEVPVRWIDSPNSRVDPLKDSIRVFRDVIMLRVRGLGK